jgi:PGF-pre-PGF domain-containing protein
VDILTPSSSSIFRTSCERKRNEKNKKIDKKLTQTTRKVSTVFIAFLTLLSFCGFACADYYPPAPPPSNVARETWVSVAFTKPESKIHINITEYDVQQMVKSITIELWEPESYLSLVIYVLKDKPLAVNELDNIQVIQYYAIRFPAEVAEKITNITIFFAIEKAIVQSRNVKEETILHYQYEENKFESCPTQMVAEDDIFIYFKTETKESPYFAVAGSLASPP